MIMIVTSSPNKDGLTAACGEQAKLGALEAGIEAEVISLNHLSIGMCQACGNGWGTCLKEDYCQVKDDFQDLYSRMKSMKGFIVITPVYYWDFSESAKAFLDRVRRCEGFKRENHYLKGKPFINVAAAGGSGTGCIPCLTNMEKFVDHVKGEKFDAIGITKKSRDYKLKTIFEASKALVRSFKS